MRVPKAGPLLAVLLTQALCVCQLLDFLLGQNELVHVSALSTEHVNCLHLTDGPRSSQFAVRILSSQFSVLDSQRRRCGRENRADALKSIPCGCCSFETISLALSSPNSLCFDLFLW